MMKVRNWSKSSGLTLRRRRTRPFHGLRHTAATRIAAAGVDPFALAYIFGWSDIRMAMRYTHATNANMKQTVRSLDALSARLGNVLATKTKTAGAVPP
jgi:integrase